MIYLSHFLLILFFFGMTKAHSQTLPRDANLRESCRKKVAGRYLSLYDTHEKTQSYLNLLKQKKAQLEKGQKETQNKLLAVKKELADAGYDIDLSDKHDSIFSRVSMIEHNLSENKQLSTNAVKRQKSLAKQIAKLKVRISHIYIFKKIKGKGLGYKFQIEYKDICPPYRYSCPLPKEKAQKLLDIFPKGEVPIACERYANFLNW